MQMPTYRIQIVGLPQFQIVRRSDVVKRFIHHERFHVLFQFNYQLIGRSFSQLSQCHFDCRVRTYFHMEIGLASTCVCRNCPVHLNRCGFQFIKPKHLLMGPTKHGAERGMKKGTDRTGWVF